MLFFLAIEFSLIGFFFKSLCVDQYILSILFFPLVFSLLEYHKEIGQKWSGKKSLWCSGKVEIQSPTISLRVVNNCLLVLRDARKYLHFSRLLKSVRRLGELGSDDRYLNGPLIH